MGELSASVAEAMRKRAVSAALGTYLFFWSSFHWQGLYTTLFTNEELIYKKHGLLKNEYVNQYFFGWHGWASVAGYIIPLLLTIIFIWPLPKYLLIHAYRQEQRHKIAKRRVKIEEEEKLEVREKKLAIQTQETIQAKIKTAEKKQQAAKKDPKIIWDEEFSDFQASREYPMLVDILQSVYAHNGNTDIEDDYGNITFQVSPQAMKMADVRELIDITSNGSKIKLTEKGKYFASKYDKDF